MLHKRQILHLTYTKFWLSSSHQLTQNTGTACCIWHWPIWDRPWCDIRDNNEISHKVAGFASRNIGARLDGPYWTDRVWQPHFTSPHMKIWAKNWKLSTCICQSIWRPACRKRIRLEDRGWQLPLYGREASVWSMFRTMWVKCVGMLFLQAI